MVLDTTLAPGGNWGYRADLENQETLVAGSEAFRFRVDGFFEVPEEIDPRTWHVTENQGNMGSCVGHGSSSCGEYCYRVGMANSADIQFSEMFSYLTSQKAGGMLGRDNGATIEGAAKASKQYGYCPVNVMPYPTRYSSSIPAAAIEAAKAFKIRSYSVCNSYEDIFAYLASGLGGVLMGMNWNDSMTPRNGLIEKYNGATSGGGHAWPFLGYSKRLGEAGRKYLWMVNSWGNSWGKNGWAEVSPTAVDQIMRHRWTVAIGLSDLTVPAVRKIDWSPWDPVE